MRIVYKKNKLMEGLFGWNIFLDNLISTNWFPDPLILQMNEILLKSNHDLFHSIDMIHHVVNKIDHIFVVYLSDILLFSG